MAQETNWFTAFDISNTTLTMKDREVFVKALSKRLGVCGEKAFRSFAGSGEHGLFWRARWYASTNCQAEFSAKSQASRHQAHLPDSANARAWLKVWKDLQQIRRKGRIVGRDDATVLLETYLALLNGTGTIERWFGQLSLAELRSLVLIGRGRGQ